MDREPAMPSSRLFQVVRDSMLFQGIESFVKVRVYPANELSIDQRQALERLLGCWGNLGAYGAMPAGEVTRTLIRLFGKGGGEEARRALFRAGGTLKFSAPVAGDRACVAWVVEWGGTDRIWIEVLLNCLEGYHVQVAPIARVELSPDVEG